MLDELVIKSAEGDIGETTTPGLFAESVSQSYEKPSNDEGRLAEQGGSCDGGQDDREVVARVHKLKDPNFRFGDRKVSGYILSHVWLPESAKVKAEAGRRVDLSEALSQPSYTLTPLYKLALDNIRFSVSPGSCPHATW